jgi:outer membrane protein OmpA-like peptidoglycan-associated protein
VLLTLLTLSISYPGYPQEAGKNAGQPQFAAGRAAVLEGVIVKRDADSFTLRDIHGTLYDINLTAATEVKERKSNPFRRAKNYGVTELMRGLQIEVKGHGGNSGRLVAEEIRFTQDGFQLASSLDARVNPVEQQLGAAETRLNHTEENALRLSGQVSELSAISNAARGGAKAAQESADSAMEAAKQADQEAKTAKSGVRAANDRITALDDFDTKKQLTVPFKLGSAQLSLEAKETLDGFAQSLKEEKGYVVEVAGFASADGNQALNRALSQKRADAVIGYLAENHSIPLRRFITPYGYGAKLPVADNKTRDGRIQNRRVEVRLLVSKGMVQGAPLAAASHE